MSKVDLSKAFDRMDWGYMEDVLDLFVVSNRLKNWIMACVRSAEFSVVVNGSGDGFLKPQCGIRQGCALSPYLFIMGMDLLLRCLMNLASSNKLVGVKLAP